MIIYRASGNGRFVDFSDQEEAESYAMANGMVVTTSTINTNEAIINVAERLQKDIVFGEQLMMQFLLDNRLDPTVTTAQSLSLLQKFAPLEALARLGDIKKIAELLPTVETDAVFTEERKTKYINIVQYHINANDNN